MAVRKNVIDPMTTLLKLHDGPQKLMHKRAKRVMDFARFKAIKDRGDKPDRKTIEQGEQFMAVNDTLKEELPKLFALTGKLVEACLNNFVQLQVQWQVVWRKKLSQAIDDHSVPSQVSEIIDSFSGDFRFTEAQVLSLGICNGSLLADAANLVNFLSPSTTFIGDELPSPRRPSTTSTNPRSRTMSYSSDASPIILGPGDRHSGSFSYPRVGENGPHLASGYQTMTGRRMRASSAASGHSPGTPELPGSYRTFLNNPSPANANLIRPTTATGRSPEESPSLPRLSVDTPAFNRLSGDSPAIVRPPSGSTYYTAQKGTPPRASSPSNRYSGFFSSAMPMSDSPRPQSPAEQQANGQGQGHGQKEFNVLFLAASVYEFNIDRARREAGYPYLTYVAGEVSRSVYSPYTSLAFSVLTSAVYRSLTSSARKASSGLQKIKTMQRIRSAGSGINILRSWHLELFTRIIFYSSNYTSRHIPLTPCRFGSIYNSLKNFGTRRHGYCFYSRDTNTFLGVRAASGLAVTGSGKRSCSCCGIMGWRN